MKINLELEIQYLQRATGQPNSPVLICKIKYPNTMLTLYGTNETAWMKEIDLDSFSENKARFGTANWKPET